MMLDCGNHCCEKVSNSVNNDVQVIRWCRCVRSYDYHMIYWVWCRCVIPARVVLAQDLVWGHAHAERQVRQSVFVCHLVITSVIVALAEHTLPCTDDVPVCGDTCGKVYSQLVSLADVLNFLEFLSSLSFSLSFHSLAVASLLQDAYLHEAMSLWWLWPGMCTHVHVCIHRTSSFPSFFLCLH